MIDSHARRHLLRDRPEFLSDGGDGIVELNSETMQALAGFRRFIEKNNQIALHADGWVVLTMQTQNRFDAAKAVILVKQMENWKALVIQAFERAGLGRGHHHVTKLGATLH